jgi:hypothetical protein
VSKFEYRQDDQVFIGKRHFVESYTIQDRLCQHRRSTHLVVALLEGEPVGLGALGGWLPLSRLHGQLVRVMIED